MAKHKFEFLDPTTESRYYIRDETGTWEIEVKVTDSSASCEVYGPKPLESEWLISAAYNVARAMWAAVQDADEEKS